jgi:hypothetical protein
MAITSGKQLSVGLRRAVVFELDADGFPLAVGTGAYEGFEVVGPKAFTLTIPDSRKISHVGNDRVLAIDYLPPTEGASAELRVAASDLGLKAVLSAVNEFVVGETTMMPLNTDKQGYETDAALLLFQQALDATTKSRRWKFYIIPKGRIIPVPAGMDENAAEERYTVAPNPTAYHLWGSAMTELEEGATEAAIIEGMAEGRPNIIAFIGDGGEDTFLFPVAKPPIDVDKVVVWVNGVLQDTELGVISTTTIPFDAAPADGDIIVVYYEY